MARSTAVSMRIHSRQNVGHRAKKTDKSTCYVVVVVFFCFGLLLFFGGFGGVLFLFVCFFLFFISCTPSNDSDSQTSSSRHVSKIESSSYFRFAKKSNLLLPRCQQLPNQHPSDLIGEMAMILTGPKPSMNRVTTTLLHVTACLL